ncbi:MAG: hypothetical protein RL148_1744 [Planctomycetota bacterium]|jgi:type III pantothenate kinase
MARGLLTVDRGNTTLDCMLHGERPRRQRLDPVGGALREWLGSDIPRTAVGVTVVQGGLQEAGDALAGLGVRLQVAGADLACPLALDYETPQTLGADRWVGALAAWRRFGASVVVDCGTATTVNGVDADGVFRGGPIAASVAAIAAGMAQLTPALPRPRRDAVPAMPPRSSAAAVDTGVLLGWCGAVERLARGMVDALGGHPTVVVTGGNADLLLRWGLLDARHEPDLVHHGLALLADGIAP